MRTRRDARERDEAPDTGPHTEPDTGSDADFQEVETAVLKLLGQVKRARQKHAVQAKRIVHLEHENHALHLALQALKEQRAKDRQVIEIWRQYTSQEPMATDASTQEAAGNPAHMPSSPPPVARIDPPALPASREKLNAHEMSQRLLPMSINVDELYDGHLKQDIITDAGCDDRIISSSPSQKDDYLAAAACSAKRSASQRSLECLEQYHDLKRSTVSSRRFGSSPNLSEKSALGSTKQLTQEGVNQESSVQFDKYGVTQECVAHDRDGYTAQADIAQVAREAPHKLFAQNDIAPKESAREDLVQEDVKDLFARSWHPSEFILNPKPRPRGPNSAQIKGRRRCVHGVGCKACGQFFDMMGYSTSINSPREFSQQETPPGFWRADFPDTSDAEAERKAAEAQWTAEGKKRLLEAINEGKYLFKDKQLRERIHLRFLTAAQ